MAKGLPYFKFTPSEWLTGDIVYESMELQGLFINICAVYWQRDGKVLLDDIEKRFKLPIAIESLIDRFMFVKNGFISIGFLDEQLQERNHKSKENSVNGSKGGKAKALKNKGGIANGKRTVSETVANLTQEEEEENKNKNKKKKRKKEELSVFGSEENIFLSMEEFERLKNDFKPGEAEEAIEYLSGYKVEKKYKSENDNLTIRRWVIDAVREKKNKNMHSILKGKVNEKNIATNQPVNEHGYTKF